MTITERNGRFTARVRVAGFPTHTQTFDSEAKAKRWIEETKVDLRRNVQVATAEQRRYTFADAIKEYKEHCNPKKTDLYKLNIVEKDFGEMAVMNLTAPKLAAYIKIYLNTDVKPPAEKRKNHPLYNGHVKRKYSDSHVRKIYFELKKVMEWHSNFRDYPIKDIFKVVKPPSTDIKRDRLLTLPELEKLYAACDKMYVNQQSWKDAILFSTETAMRAGEQLALLWSDIHFDTFGIHVRKEISKTNTFREVPMTTPVVAMLKRRYENRKKGEERVFPEWSNSNALAHRFKVIVKNAGIGDYRWHDNRHYATTNFFIKPPKPLRDVEIMKITGHTNISTLKRYSHLRTDEMHSRLW